MSSPTPGRAIGYLSIICGRDSSNAEVRGFSTSPGQIAFTVTFGATSRARPRVNPSTPPLAAA